MKTNDEIIAMLRRHVRHELPVMNRGIESHGQAALLIDRFRSLADAGGIAARQTSDADVALTLLQLISFGVSSVERHVQFGGGAPGDGVAALGVEATLMRLSAIAAHPPRDSYDTYWLRNGGNAPLTFTGSPQESMFIRIVNEMHQRQKVAVAALEPICAGDVQAVSPMAIDAIEFAADIHERLVLVLKSFMSKRAEWSMSPAFFAFSIRPYLCAYPVGGQVMPGPETVDLPGQMQMDLAVGLADEAYRQSIAGRMGSLMPRDRRAIDSLTTRQSLVSRILGEAGLTEAEIMEMPEQQVVACAAQRPWLQATLFSLERLTRAVHSTAAHFAIMQGYLKSRRIDRRRRAPLLVQKLLGIARAAASVTPGHAVRHA